jgi:hypothetical protein
MLVRGSVDVVMPTEVRGWAFAPGRSEPVLVQAVLNHEILGETAAKLHRVDLAEAGLGDGRCGYAIDLYRPIDALYLPFIAVKVDGGDAELPRAPMLGFGEFFTALHAAYPSVGRHRTVFGGLWTDRTDARALLRGKTEVGHVAAEAVDTVAQMIDNGFAIAASKVVSRSGLQASDQAALAGAIVEEPVLLSVMRAVLEDNPVILAVETAERPAPGFTQPSATSGSGSPAECLLIIVPLTEGVQLDIVRDSHRLPEFTAQGSSRWATRGAVGADHVPPGQGMLDSYTLAVGAAALVGPGTLHRLRCTAGGTALLATCAPKRAVPVAIAAEVGRQERVRPSGVRVWA